MEKRLFKVVCKDCDHWIECRKTIIERKDVYQSLGDAKLYAWVDCPKDVSFDDPVLSFKEVKEEIK